MSDSADKFDSDIFSLDKRPLIHTELQGLNGNLYILYENLFFQVMVVSDFGLRCKTLKRVSAVFTRAPQILRQGREFWSSMEESRD